MRLPVVNNASFPAPSLGGTSRPIDLSNQRFGEAVKLTLSGDLRGTRQELEGSMAGGSIVAQGVSLTVPTNQVANPTDPTKVNPVPEVRKEVDPKTAPKYSGKGSHLNIVA